MSSESSVTQYGNNFYFLFEAIRKERSGIDTDLIEMYVRRAERNYPDQWQIFPDENTELLQTIFDALAGLMIVGRFRQDHRMLLRSHDWEKADAFATATNYERLEVDAWNILNPLLKAAGEKMAEYSINQQVFWY